MPNHELACLNRAWPMICQIITTLELGLARWGAGQGKPLRLLCLARLAESLVRRWLVLSACLERSWPKVGSLTRNQTRSASAVRTIDQGARSPRFRLFEPERSYGPIFEPLESDVAPRISVEEPSQQAKQSQRPFNLSNLKTRCLALADVIDHPTKHKKRMARWLARAAARAKTRLCKSHPFRVGFPPGASHRLKRRDPERQSLLNYLDRLARDAVTRARPP